MIKYVANSNLIIVPTHGAAARAMEQWSTRFVLENPASLLGMTKSQA